MNRFAIMGLIAICSPISAADENAPIPTALHDYVKQAEPVYSWKLREKRDFDEGRVYDIDLTSQTWQGIVWTHVLHIHEPKEVRHTSHVLLFVTGGRNGDRPKQENIAFGLGLAKLAGARVAILYQVPNQPLLGNRREDDLITETWLRFLKTGDASWPLLFPMVKSAVKAMDAVEEVAKSEWKQPVKGFVITGASKRGWTSWLTPVADKRVVATAPIVIDVLNFKAQMRHQLDTWGKYSEQIIDYTSKGLVKIDNETARDIQLRRMMDPYTYLKKLTLPKLMIIGTNDRYWVLDALNLYWDDLVGPKYVHYVPNAGHSLRGGRDKAMATIAAFFQHVVTDKPFPKLNSQYAKTKTGWRLTVSATPKPVSFQLWTARSDTKDFRQSKWTATEVKPTKGQFVASVSKPKTGYVAFFGEGVYRIGRTEYSVSTRIHRK